MIWGNDSKDENRFDDLEVYTQVMHTIVQLILEPIFVFYFIYSNNEAIYGE